MTRIKVWGFVLLALSFLLAATQSLVDLYDGRQDKVYPLVERGNAWPVPGGAVLKSSGAQSFRPVTISLDPTMNPVAFMIRGRREFELITNWPVKNRYELLVFEGERLLERKTFEIHWGKENLYTTLFAAFPHTLRIFPVDVPRAGQYHVMLDETTLPEFNISGMALEVRHNAVASSKQVWDLVIFLAVPGALLVLVGSWRQYFEDKRRRQNQASAQSAPTGGGENNGL